MALALGSQEGGPCDPTSPTDGLAQSLQDDDHGRVYVIPIRDVPSQVDALNYGIIGTLFLSPAHNYASQQSRSGRRGLFP